MDVYIEKMGYKWYTLSDERGRTLKSAKTPENLAEYCMKKKEFVLKTKPVIFCKVSLGETEETEE